MLIGEAPGEQEITKGEPFVGKAGFVLDNWLLKAIPTLQIAKERGEVSIMNTLRCLPPKDKQGRPYPKGEERELAEAHCRQYDHIPDTVHTVVLFGESAQRCWFGPELEAEDAIDKRLGHELKGTVGRIGRVYEKGGRKWVFAPHPAYILRQPSLVAHGQAALAIVAGTDKTLDVVYASWEASIEGFNNALLPA